MERRLDPEGAHLAALRRLADFRAQNVLEFGCGEGRLTAGIAPEAAHVFAFDVDAEAVGKARASLPPSLQGRVRYHVGGAKEIALEAASYDLALFSWAL